ncbi:MAG: helix-turn-helix transcriptional regulator [Candidatus Dormibacteraeota bacterium]|nr:helix-turn-helix transcriptional regulator [Candidatus Dormibacteraeota bacterium]
MGQPPLLDHNRAAKAEAPRVFLPKQFLTPGLLLLIDEQPAYGYELVQRLAAFGVGAADHGSIYRALNVMESGGLVSSQWERSPSGPRRRRYVATDLGRQLLCRWATSLEQAGELIQAFLGRFREGQDLPAGNDVNGSNGDADRRVLAETQPAATV